jgi:hypothetical protein
MPKERDREKKPNPTKELSGNIIQDASPTFQQLQMHR